jgi:hypothetical protein
MEEAVKTELEIEVLYSETVSMTEDDTEGNADKV